MRLVSTCSILITVFALVFLFSSNGFSVADNTRAPSDCTVHVDYFESTWSVSEEGVALLCPKGDGNMSETIYVTLLNTCQPAGAPSPALDFDDLDIHWVSAGYCGLSTDERIYICTGAGGWYADDGTDGNGETEFTTTPCGYGFAEAYHIMVQARDVVIPQNAGVDACVPIAVRTPDIDLNGEVDLLDLSLFSNSYPTVSVSTLAEKKCDLNADGTVDILDWSIFGSHYTYTPATTVEFGRVFIADAKGRALSARPFVGTVIRLLPTTTDHSSA